MVPGNTPVGDHVVRARRRPSWILAAPDGSYSVLPCWDSRESWLEAVTALLRSPLGLQLRKKHEVSEDKVLLCAQCDALTADTATGRNVGTANATVATRTGLSVPAVRRSRAVIAGLGLSTTVVRGRRLTLQETRQARSAHGRRQTYAASTRALIMPRGTRLVSTTEHQPFKPHFNRSSLVLKNSPKRAKARSSADAPRRPATTTRIKPKNFTERPRPLKMQILAAELVDGAPNAGARRRPLKWLLKRGHIGQLCDLLERRGITEKDWTSGQILDAIDLYTATFRGKITDIDDRKNPLAFFAWLLSEAIPLGVESPAARSKREVAARQQAQAEQAQKDLELRQRIAAEKETIDAIVASMKADRRSRRQMGSPTANAR